MDVEEAEEPTADEGPHDSNDEVADKTKAVTLLTERPCDKVQGYPLSELKTAPGGELSTSPARWTFAEGGVSAGFRRRARSA